MTKQLRVFHGVVNIAGISSTLSQMERERGLVSHSYVFQGNKMHSKIDFDLNIGKSIFKRLFLVPIHFFKALFRYDIFHFYYGQTFFLFGLDLPILKLFGKKIVMTYCGSEIRIFKGVELERNPYAKYMKFKDDGKSRSILNKKGKLFAALKWVFAFKYDSPVYDNRKKIMMCWHNLWVNKFFAYRSLYAYASTSIPNHKIVSKVFLNNITHDDPDKISGYKKFVPNKIPKVIHSPTNILGKGTKFIRQAVEELKEEQEVEFEYIEMMGVSAEELKRIFIEDIDIVIDQVLVGSFGSLSIEVMSYGKPIISYVLESIIKEYCPGLPIFNSNIDTIKENLKTLIQDKELRLELGKKGKEFIRQHYNKDKIVDQVIQEYRLL